MPGQRRGSYSRRALSLRPVNSIKNSFSNAGGLTGTLTNEIIAKAVNAPVSATGATELNHGSTIKAIWLVIDICGLGGTGVLNFTQAYLMKNPGNNLTPPAPISVGTSNEKKFVIKEWAGMIMRNQDGNPPLHWEGWIKIPKRYQRMGTDDVWSLVMICSSGLTAHFFIQAIYKWFS